MKDGAVFALLSVVCDRDYLSVLYYDRADGDFVFRRRAFCRGDGFFHIIFFIHVSPFAARDKAPSNPLFCANIDGNSF